MFQIVLRDDTGMIYDISPNFFEKEVYKIEGFVEEGRKNTLK